MLDCAVTRFVDASIEHMNRHCVASGRRLSTRLHIPAYRPILLAPHRVPACAILDSFTHHVDDHLLQYLLDCSDTLHWRLPGFGKLPESLHDSLAVAEVIGPAGMFPSQRIRFGVLLQAENTHYPQHRHQAEEFYLVLSGTAQWMAGGSEPTGQPPGSLVHHWPQQRHSMVTHQEPLIALWVWQGDIDGYTYAVDSSASGQ